jgi:hypothetical protein
MGTPKRWVEPTATSAPHQATVGGGVLEEHAGGRCRLEVEVFRRADLESDAHGLGAGPQHADRLRVAVLGDEEGRLAAPCDGVTERHGLGGSGGLVQEGGVGQGQTRQVRNHRLEVEQCLEPPLGDLGLIGRVLGVPAGVLEDVALDHRRHDRVRVAHADAGPDRTILGGDRSQPLQDLPLTRCAVPEAGQPQGRREPDRVGNRLVDQGVEGFTADPGEHLLDLRLGGAQVAMGKGVRRLEQVHGGAGSVVHRGFREFDVPSDRMWVGMVRIGRALPRRARAREQPDQVRLTRF